MGLMQWIFGGVNTRNVGSAVTEVAEVFTVNKERQAGREADSRSAALNQFASEFQNPRQGLFDRFVNALNRLPRPAFALGTISLFVYAFRSPEEFSVMMTALSVIPDQLWWVLSAVITFFFGGRVLDTATRRSAPPVFVAPVVVEKEPAVEPSEEIVELLEDILDDNEALKDAKEQ